MNDQDGFGPAELQAQLKVGDRALADLLRFRELLADASQRMNLVGPSAMAVFWRRHVLDSAQLMTLEPNLLRWTDVGSGAGLPGLILAILGRERPGMTLQLVESITKRCRFLQEVVDELALPAAVLPHRLEALPKLTTEVLTARAVAPLPRLLEYGEHLLKRGAVGLFLKGRRVEAEVEEALQTWRFHYALEPSLSDPEGRILRIWSVKRASA